MTTNSISYHAGINAERQVARQYLRRGLKFLGHRWRGCAGEIDLIFRCGEELVFVEVKKSATHERALARLGQRQIRRILRAAEEFAGKMSARMDVPMRFDVATVDQFGDVRVLENALAA